MLGFCSGRVVEIKWHHSELEPRFGLPPPLLFTEKHTPMRGQGCPTLFSARSVLGLRPGRGRADGGAGGELRAAGAVGTVDGCGGIWLGKCEGRTPMIQWLYFLLI